MRYAPRALVAGGLCLAVSLVAACGSQSGLLSSSEASSLSSQLDKVSSDLGAGDCAGATSNLAPVAQQIQSLPSSVNATLRANLNKGVATVETLIARQCNSSSTSTATTQTATTAAPATTTPTPPPHTTSTATPPPATTPTPPGTTTSSGPGSGGAGIGQGNGGPSNQNGNGNGNGH